MQHQPKFLEKLQRMQQQAQQSNNNPSKKGTIKVEKVELVKGKGASG